VTAAGPAGGVGVGGIGDAVGGGMPPADIADRVLELVGAHAAGAEADVHVIATDEGLTRFAASFVHQNVAEEDLRVRLRVAVDGCWAIASTNRVDPDSLAALVRSTVDAARHRPVDPAFPGLAPPEPATATGNWDPATAATTPDQRAALVRDFIGAAGGLQTAGYVATAADRGAYANTAGQRLAAGATSAAVDGIARTGSSDGVARHSAVRLADIAGAEAGAVAAAAARAAADPTDLEPGDYEVVLEPACVADMLKFLGIHGFNGRSVAEGRSFVRLGEPQFDPAFDLWDDATDELSPSLPYDADGTPHRRVDLVVKGVTSVVLHDRRTAAAAGAASTGHAVLGSESWGPFPTDLRLRPGDGGTAADLASRMERGLWVSDFWYTRILDPRTTVVTGLTRNGVWLVEDGKVVRPVRNLRFTQSYVDALGPGAVRGIGSVTGGLPDRWSGGLYVVPSLHLGRWHFTGGATG
jgi:predicted Zn-dependent protease